MSEPITCAACKSGPRNTHRGRLCLCASVDAKLRVQERNTRRLRERWENMKAKAEPLKVADLPPDIREKHERAMALRVDGPPAAVSLEEIEARRASLPADYEAGVSNALDAYCSGERGVPHEECRAGREGRARTPRKL